MGHQVDHVGAFAVSPPLHATERAWLEEFAWGDFDDGAWPVPEDVWGHCGWVGSADGSQLTWDGSEKFYEGDRWLEWLVDQVIGPDARLADDPRLDGFTFDHVVDGVVHRFAEPEADVVEASRITVRDNVVTVHAFEVPQPLPLESDPDGRLGDAFFHLSPDGDGQPAARRELEGFLATVPLAACGELATFLREVADAFGPRDEVEASIDAALAPAAATSNHATPTGATTAAPTTDRSPGERDDRPWWRRLFGG